MTRTRSQANFGTIEARHRNIRIVNAAASHTLARTSAIGLQPTREGWLAGRSDQFLSAIQDAISTTLRTPLHDKILRLVQHAHENFAIPDWASERFTHIEITMFPGRAIATKRTLYKAIVDRLQSFGVPANDVKIILIEVSRENVAMRGGYAASDFDIGYETAV